MKKTGRGIGSRWEKYTAVLLAVVMVLSAGTCTPLVFAEKGALEIKAQVLQAESAPGGKTSGAGEAADAEPAFYESTTVDGVTVTVSAPEGVFPDGAALSVKSLGITSEENVAAQYSFDINILDAEGKEIEPDTSYGEVSVSFRISDVPYYDDVNVYHGSEKMGVSVSEGFSDVTCEVKTDSFSSYSVVFTYNELKYVLAGCDSVKLSAIQSAVGLPGTVKSAVSSDPSLVSVTQNADGADWTVTSLQPFASEETLTLAIDGAEYIIALTDPAGFTITGGTAGTDYTYDVTSNYVGTLTVLTDTALTITTGGGLTYHKIAISSGITANLTLHDANIEARQYYSKGSPIDVGTATLNLTVTGTNNLFIGMNEYSAAALRVPPGGTLTITAASTGSLTADNLTGGWGSSFGAGIGGGTFFNTNGEGCGTVIINGGTITAKSYMGAGIGGGGNNYGQSGGTVKITGGTVNAESICGAGIGGSRSAFSGGDGAEVTISGGTVSASSDYGAGIGGGYGGQVGGSGRTVIISGGTVNASSDYGAGIGGAHSWSTGGSGGTVAISGGTVNAASSGRGAGIGGGGGDPSNGLNVGGDGGQVTISGGTVTASGSSEGIGRGTGDSPHHDPSHGTVTITPSYPYIIVKAGADSSAPEIEGSPFHSWIDTVIDVSEQKYFHSREQTPIITVPSHMSAPYTGAAQYPPAITVTEPESAYIRYGTDGRNYVDSLPIFRDAGTYTIFYHIMAYSYATVTGSYLYTITPAEVALSWTGTSFLYDGSEHAPACTITSGLIGSDSCNVTVTGGQTNAGTNYTASASLSNSNYKLPSSNATCSFSITKRPITLSGITVNDRPYDGTKAATLNFDHVTFTGLVSGDNLTVSGTGTFADSNVGTGKTVTISDLALGGTDAGNYVLAASGHQENTTASITAAEVVVSGITAGDRVYDKTAAATLNYDNVTFSGLVSGDNLTVSGTGTFADANVGTGKTVTITDLSLGGSSVSNYTLASTGQQDSATASITAAEVVVSGITAGDKIYDGTAAATLNYDHVTFSGLVSGDNLTVSGTGTFADANVGTGKTVTISDLALGGTGAGNYVPAASGHQENTTASITAAEVVVSGITAGDRIYDRTAAATLNYDHVTFTGLVSGDDLTVNGTGTFADANVGTGKKVTITDLALGGSSVSNYTLASTGQQSSTTASITAAEVVVSGITAVDRIYDGTAAATLNYDHVTFTGLVSGDNLTVSGTGTFADANVGTGKTVTISDLALGGTGAGNYVLAASGHQENTTADIINAHLTDVSVSQQGTLTYTGAGQTAKMDASATTVDGTVVIFTYSTSEKDTYSDTVPSFKEAGSYTVYFRAEAKNHTTETGTCTITITAKEEVSNQTVEVTENNDGSVTTRVNDDLFITITPKAPEDADCEPTQVVRDAGTRPSVLTEGRDYTVSYRYDPESGMGSALFLFKGNYRGTVTVPFLQPVYKITYRENNGVWTKGSPGGLEIYANGNLAKFDYVAVDGRKIDSSNITAAAGSTEITLKQSYLDTLLIGEHEFAIYYPDGKAVTTFTVKAGSSVRDKLPKTGESSNMGLGIMLMLLGGCAFVIIAYERRRRSTKAAGK